MGQDKAGVCSVVIHLCTVYEILNFATHSSHNFAASGPQYEKDYVDDAKDAEQADVEPVYQKVRFHYQDDRQLVTHDASYIRSIILVRAWCARVCVCLTNYHCSQHEHTYTRLKKRTS